MSDEILSTTLYDGSEFHDGLYSVASGQTSLLGNHISSIDLRDPAPPTSSLPTTEFPVESDTSLLFHFNEGYGYQTTDSVVAMVGNLESATIWSAGQFLNALSFPGGNAYGMKTQAVNICPMSVEIWVRVDQPHGVLASQMQGGGNTGQNKWRLALNNLRPSLEIWSAGGSQSVNSFNEVTLGSWHLIMFSYDCNQTAKLYLDNVLVGEFLTASQWNSGATTFEVGSGESQSRCDCVFDELRVSNSVRLPQYVSPTATPTYTVTSTATQTPNPTSTATSPATPTTTPLLNGVELLTSPWNLVRANGGSKEKYQSIDPNVLSSRTHIRVTLDLHGLNAFGGDASALIFDQNGWKYISLSNYVVNGFNGLQTVDIPISAFGLDLSQPVGTLHTRFWNNQAFTVDITSVIAYGFATTATQTATATSAATPTSTPVLPAISRMVLINAVTNQDIADLYNGYTIDIYVLGTNQFSVRAEGTADIGSVLFGFNGDPNFHNENNPPYTLYGDDSGPTYVPVTFNVGTYTVSAKPFTQDSGGGTQGNVVSYTINVINSAPTNTVAPTNTNTPTITATSTQIVVSEVQLMAVSPWILTSQNGDSELYNNIASDVLVGRDTIRVTFDLNGLCALSGDASAIIFNQSNGWHYVALSQYAQNCLDGTQTVEIPISDFALLATEGVSAVRSRFWFNAPYSVEITSVIAFDSPNR